MLQRVLEAFARDLEERVELNLSECFIDGTFVVAKKGAAVGIPKGHDETKRGKGRKFMAVSDAAGTPLALHIASANPYEVTLVHETLASRNITGKPEKLIGGPMTAIHLMLN